MESIWQKGTPKPEDFPVIYKYKGSNGEGEWEWCLDILDVSDGEEWEEDDQWISCAKLLAMK